MYVLEIRLRIQVALRVPHMYVDRPYEKPFLGNRRDSRKDVLMASRRVRSYGLRKETVRINK